MAADVRDTWFRSSSCTPGKNCVEIGRSDTDLIIRDSKSGMEIRTSSTVGWTTLAELHDRLV